MIAAGDDPHVKAVVLVMPFISGAIDVKSYPAGIIDQAWKEREMRCKDPNFPPSYIPVWDDNGRQAAGERGQIFLHGPKPFEFIDGAQQRSAAAKTPWTNELSLESFYQISVTEPRDHIRKISPRPMLYLAATTDPLSGPFEEQKKVFEMAGGPKEFVILDDHHINNYFDSSFEKNIKAQIDFLQRYL